MPKMILSTLVTTIFMSAGAHAIQILSATDPQNMTEAMRAAARGDLQKIQALAPSRADLASVNSNHASILYFAAQSKQNSVQMFEWVRQTVGESQFEELLNTTVKSNNHSVALEAVFNINTDLVLYLVDLHKRGVKVDFSSPTVFGWTPKTFAEREKMNFASQLPEGLIKAEERNQWMQEQQNLWLAGLSEEDKSFHQKGLELISAIETFNLGKIQELVVDGTPINARYGRLGATPLNSTVRAGMTVEQVNQASTVQALLLQFGADPNFAESGIMMVPSGFRESVFGYAALIENMLNQLSVDPSQREQYLNSQGPLNGYTKLMDAAKSGRVDTIKLLVAAGADRSLQGHNGLRALDLAQLYNEASQTPMPEEVLQLLEVGD